MFEPLRGKKHRFVGYNGFIFNDVKSAVDGLKNSVESKVKDGCNNNDNRLIIDLIDKWFDDVVD